MSCLKPCGEWVCHVNMDEYPSVTLVAFGSIGYNIRYLMYVQSEYSIAQYFLPPLPRT